MSRTKEDYGNLFVELCVWVLMTNDCLNVKECVWLQRANWKFPLGEFKIFAVLIAKPNS